MTGGNRILVVDDEPGLAHALAITLRASGWDVATGMRLPPVMTAVRRGEP